MPDPLKIIIDKAVAAGYGDEDIRLLADEHKRRLAPEAPRATIGPTTRAERLSATLANLEGLPGVIVGAGRRVMEMALPWNSSERVDLNPYQQLGGHAADAGALALAVKPSAAALQKAPGIVAQGIKGADRAVLAATDFIEAHPSISTAAGAITGGMHGGIEGALVGLAGGRAAPGLLKLLTRSGKLAEALRQAAPEAATAAKAAAPIAEAAVENPLARELLKRMPDWRTVDAVPIDAIARDISRGGTILEAGESQIGLAEQLARLLKTPSVDKAAEVERIAKALRQRMHIRARAQ